MNADSNQPNDQRVRVRSAARRYSDGAEESKEQDGNGLATADESILSIASSDATSLPPRFPSRGKRIITDTEANEMAGTLSNLIQKNKELQRENAQLRRDLQAVEATIPPQSRHPTSVNSPDPASTQQDGKEPDSMSEASSGAESTTSGGASDGGDRRRG